MAGPGRWLTRILLGLVGLIALALVVIYVMSERYLARTYPVREVAITLPTDSASLARGERLARLSCYGCHGETLTGTVMFEAPLVITNVRATKDHPRALEPGEACVREDGVAVVRAGRDAVELLAGRLEEGEDDAGTELDEADLAALVAS